MSTKGEVGEGGGELLHFLVEVATKGEMGEGRGEAIHLLIEI